MVLAEKGLRVVPGQNHRVLVHEDHGEVGRGTGTRQTWHVLGIDLVPEVARLAGAVGGSGGL